MKVYIDVNILYYFLTDHPEFGERSEKLIREYWGKLATSSLTVWLLYVLTKDKNVIRYLEELEIEILPLNFEILKIASEVQDLDFEDAIHYATMKVYGIKEIISNDRDFDRFCKRIF